MTKGGKPLDVDTLITVGEWLRGGHDLTNIARDGGRIVTANDIAALLKGELPENNYNPAPEKHDKAANSVIAEVFEALDKMRGYRPPKRSAEAQAIGRMSKHYTTDEIIATYKHLKEQPFWQDKELFMMTLESQIGAVTKKTTIKNRYDNQLYGHMFQR